MLVQRPLVKRVKSSVSAKTAPGGWPVRPIQPGGQVMGGGRIRRSNRRRECADGSWPPRSLNLFLPERPGNGFRLPTRRKARWPSTTPAATSSSSMRMARAAIQADCNNVGATYTTEGNNISIVPGPSTMAACPDPIHWTANSWPS